MPVAVHSMLAMFEDKFYFFFTVYLSLSFCLMCRWIVFSYYKTECEREKQNVWDGESGENISSEWRIDRLAKRASDIADIFSVQVQIEFSFIFFDRSLLDCVTGILLLGLKINLNDCTNRVLPPCTWLIYICREVRLWQGIKLILKT